MVQSTTLYCTVQGWRTYCSSLRVLITKLFKVSEQQNRWEIPCQWLFAQTWEFFLNSSWWRTCLHAYCQLLHFKVNQELSTCHSNRPHPPVRPHNMYSVLWNNDTDRESGSFCGGEDNMTVPSQSLHLTAVRRQSASLTWDPDRVDVVLWGGWHPPQTETAASSSWQPTCCCCCWMLSGRTLRCCCCWQCFHCCWLTQVRWSEPPRWRTTRRSAPRFGRTVLNLGPVLSR